MPLATPLAVTVLEIQPEEVRILSEIQRGEIAAAIPQEVQQTHSEIQPLGAVMVLPIGAPQIHLATPQSEAMMEQR